MISTKFKLNLFKYEKNGISPKQDKKELSAKIIGSEAWTLITFIRFTTYFRVLVFW